MNSIKLSIVVPVYNVEKYLDECLNSLIKAYQDGIEIILVDDGATDNSGIMCDEYARKYDFIEVRHRKNGGLSAARNTGIADARGEYIWVVDSDDYISETSINNILDGINRNVDLIIGNYSGFYDDGRRISYNDFNNEDSSNMLPYEYFESLGNISYVAWRFIVKHSLIKENNLYFFEGLYHEDEEWTPRVLCAAKSFVTIKEPIYNYRLGNPNSIIGMLNSKKVMDKIFICESIYKRIIENKFSEPINDFLKSRIVYNYVAALNECCKYKQEERKKIVKKLEENKYLLDGMPGKKAKVVKCSINTIGIVATSKLLLTRNKLK